MIHEIASHGAAVPAWPPLARGTAVLVVKRAPDGGEVTRYPGIVAADAAPSPWLAVEARWTDRRVEMDGLVIDPGDTLREYFSPRHRFNAFAVFAPDGALRGWYANATHPASLDLAADPPLLIWHDLFVDVVALPDGRVTVRDEDELAESALLDRDPALHASILATREEILSLVSRCACPFHDRDASGEESVAGAAHRSKPTDHLDKTFISETKRQSYPPVDRVSGGW